MHLPQRRTEVQNLIFLAELTKQGNATATSKHSERPIGSLPAWHLPVRLIHDQPGIGIIVIVDDTDVQIRGGGGRGAASQNA